VRPIHLLNELADDLGTCRVGELRELAQMVVGSTTRRETLSRRADENCPLDWRGKSDQFLADKFLSVLTSEARDLI
jgi:hypothetical protein